MLHELSLVCMSIGVVTKTLPRLSLANGSTSCVTDLFCKDGPGPDGYVGKEAGGNADVQTTVCEALNVHYDCWANEERVIRITWEVIQNNSDVIKAVNNTASEILALLDTLKGRQAASAALQVAQFFLFVGYLLTLSVLYAVKKCRQHRARQVEEEFELMEQKLQERKAKRRSAAARAKSGPSPTQE